MRDLTQLTDADLQERLKLLEGLKEAADLRKQIETELAERQKAREAKKDEAEKEAEKVLLRKQHDVLGKYYLLDGKYYKVVGVVLDRVFLEAVAVCNVANYEGECKTYTSRQIDTLLREANETTKEEYLSHKIDVNQTITDLTKTIRDSFDFNTGFFNDFARFMKDWTNFKF